MEKCTKFMGWVVVILFITLLIAILPTEKEYEVYEDTIRLHILAESNEAKDQAVKLKIRDRVLEKYGDMLGDAASYPDALLKISRLEGEIEEDVDLWLMEEGFDYRSKCEIVEEYYERREYGDFTLPSGEYTSVKIMLGEGEGENWWCVMYPPLCLDIAREHRADYSREVNDLIIGKYVVKFKLLELIEGYFR